MRILFIVNNKITVQRLIALWELFGTTPGLSSTHSNSRGLVVIQIFLCLPHVCVVLSCTLLDADTSSLAPGEIQLYLCCAVVLMVPHEHKLYYFCTKSGTSACCAVTVAWVGISSGTSPQARFVLCYTMPNGASRFLLM